MKDRIKAVRKSMQLTQKDFGSKIGVKPSTITAYETGLRSPTESVVMAICHEFNVDKTWLETGEGEPFIDTTSQTLEKITQRYNESNIFRAVLDAYAQLEPDEQAALEHYISMLSDAIAKGENAETVNPATVGDQLQGKAYQIPDTRPDRAQGE